MYHFTDKKCCTCLLLLNDIYYSNKANTNAFMILVISKLITHALWCVNSSYDDCTIVLIQLTLQKKWGSAVWVCKRQWYRSLQGKKNIDCCWGSHRLWCGMDVIEWLVHSFASFELWKALKCSGLCTVLKFMSFEW